MQTLVNARWGLTIVALICGLISAAPWVRPMTIIPSEVFDGAVVGAAALQALGTFAMSRNGAGWLSVTMGYIAALCWIVVLFSGAAAVAAGSGGLVYGLLVMMPATALGLLLQIASLIGFARRR